MRILIFNGLLLCCVIYSLVRGGAPERLVALCFLLAAAATRSLHWWSAAPFDDAGLILLMIDLLLLTALSSLALVADRNWPIWLAAFQLVEVALQVVIVFDVEFMRWTYAILHGAWSYPMLALLVAATWRHQRRLALDGVDSSWSTSSVQWLASRRRR